MLHSLRLRLLLTMVAVVAVTAGTVAMLAQQITISEFQRFIALSDQRSQNLGAVFSEASQLPDQSEADRQIIVQRMAGAVGDRVVVADQARVVVADSAGGALVGRPLPDGPLDQVLLIQLDSADDLLAHPAQIPVLATTELVSGTAAFGGSVALMPEAGELVSDQMIFFGASVSAPAPGSAEYLQVARAPVTVTWSRLAEPDPIRAGFVSGVNRSIGLSLVVAGVAALLLTAALSRRIIRPVEELRLAAERMATGDLSQRVLVRSNDEIATLGRAFNSMAEGLQRAEQLRRHMVSDVAHELRTPLTNIRGYLEALRDGVARPSGPMIESLHEEALLLNRLIDDLQDLALAESGHLRLQLRPADLVGVAAQAVSVAQPRMGAKGVRCRVEAAPGLPCAMVDAERIGQVLRNLLNNALAHTPAGGEIVVALAAAEPGLGDTARIAVSVADTGCGIAPEDLPLIFERFYRADRSRARATGGAGLGLTIVRTLVEAHGGTLRATSQLGRGTCIMFVVGAAGPPVN
jgi:signal transduction histidine kinase